MDPNFADLERLIKEDPARANDLVSKWQAFEEQNPDTLPTDADTLLGRYIEEVIIDLRDQDEDEQMQAHGEVDPSSFPVQFATLTALSLALHKGPKTFEDDRDYQKLVKKHEELWLEKNKAKNFDSKEGMDYLYGSLEDEGEDAPTLKKDAEQEFRNDPRFKKRVKRYDNEKKKVYKKLEEDPSVINKSYEIQNHAINRSRLAYLKAHEDTKTSEEMSELIKKRTWEKFAAEYPEKAKAYATKNDDIKKAYEKQEIKKQLGEMEQRRVTQAPQDTSVEETSQRLRPITPTPLRPIPTEHRIATPQAGRFFDRGGRTITGIGRQFGAQGRRLTSGIGRQGTRLVARTGMAAGRAAFGLLMSSPLSPIGWIAIVLPLVIIIAVFIIIMLEGGGGGLFQKGVAKTECFDIDGNIIVVTNGNTCAINLQDYYRSTEGDPALTVRCLDKCTDFVNNTCDRDQNNTCDPLTTSCGAPSYAFCYEYSPPLVPPLKRYRDCNTGGDGYDGTALGVTSCSGGIADPTITPTPTPTPTLTPTPTP